MTGIFIALLLPVAPVSWLISRSLRAAQSAVLQQLVRRDSHVSCDTDHAGRVGQHRELPRMAGLHLHRTLPVHILHG